jgi:mRNA interferase MazF
MERGDVWWATLPPPVGSGPGGRRPVVIVQSNSFTHTRLRTVIVVPVGSNTALANARGNVLLPNHFSGLRRDSVANVSLVVAVDKSLLTDFVQQLPDSLIEQIDNGLRLALDLV